MTTDGIWDYSYSAEGNVTKKERISDGLTWTYGYDQRNQMIWAERRTTDAGTLEQRSEYQYNAWGDRIEKKVDADGDSNFDTTERYAIDAWKTGPQRSYIGRENADVFADLDGSSSLTTRYLRGDVIDQLFARIGSDDSAFWLLTDRQLSVRDVIDDTGLLKNSITYGGFGELATETNSAFRGRYTYTSRELDVETDLQYNRARYYDSATGRWTSQDPLGFDAGDGNLYRYVTNRYMNGTDPSGLDDFGLPRYADEKQRYMTGRPNEPLSKLPSLQDFKTQAKLLDSNLRYVYLRTFDPRGGDHVGKTAYLGIFHRLDVDDLYKKLSQHLFEPRLTEKGNAVYIGGESVYDFGPIVRAITKEDIRVADALAKERLKVEVWQWGWNTLTIFGYGYARASYTHVGVPGQTISNTDRGGPRLVIPTSGHHYNQINIRGWTINTIWSTYQDPFTTRNSTNRETGNSATVYYNRDGSHIVVDDVTRALVQVSPRHDLENWIPDSNIINPYRP